MSGYGYQLPFGAERENGDQTRFALWAPDQDKVVLEIEDRSPLTMERQSDGTHAIVVDCPAGTAYNFRLGDGLVVPDPASRAQKDDVHGPSLVVDPREYAWHNLHWKGRPWREMVIYEVHVGCYGGFKGVERDIPRLAELGITAIELMPVADFSGQHNWGYDGVLPYAPDRAYGSPSDLKRLIDTAHQHNICVYLDVVYNHFGPDGNYLHAYASAFFDESTKSPWGAAIDFKRPQVRDFFLHNALYWLHEYRVDGLRFDAVHAISEQDWLDEMAAKVRSTIEPDRHVHLMLENERNTSSHLEKDFDAQWNDDMHNVVHVLLTGEEEGYYLNYQEDPTSQLARAMAEGFVYQGEPAPANGNEPRGTSSGHLSADKFIFFLQNHDQIGNRAFGERLTTLVKPEALKAAVTLQLMCPQIPLLFMGEERGLETPFLFFTDFHGDLADAVREGRRKEFSAFSHFRDPKIRNQIPDPNDPQTFNRSCEHIAERRLGPEQKDRHEFYRDLLATRRAYITPHMQHAVSLGAEVRGEACVSAAWQLENNRVLEVVVNLGTQACAISRPRGNLLAESQAGAGKSASEGSAIPFATSAFIRETHS